MRALFSRRPAVAPPPTPRPVPAPRELTLKFEGNIEALRLGPNDHVLITFEQTLSLDQADEIRDHLKGFFGERPVAILSGGAKASVVTPRPPAPIPTTPNPGTHLP